MSDAALGTLAAAAGIATEWHDVHGRAHKVGPDTLRALLRALALPADSPAELADSHAELTRAMQAVPPLVTCREGETPNLPGHAAAGALAPGYHRIDTDAGLVTVAVAPARCHDVPPGRPWGLAAQLYGLRRDGDGGIGDFAALADFARGAARRGADALAISPVHAQFSADPGRFSPYAPSSRIMLNALHAAPPQGHAALEAAELVDWPEAARHRLDTLRARFDAGVDESALAAFRAAQGDALERHARFEALHARQFGRDPAQWHWRDWPAGLRDPASPEVAGFAREHGREIAFHAWLQMLADQGLAQAQAAARDGGMRIGLISDLAVGTDGGGSHAWSRQDETLPGVSVGAPPDLLNTKGQNWGLSTFSPLGLRRHGHGAFIEMLRAALRHAGGMRIDHAMGLQRLWLVPDGADASEGAFLGYPLADLLNLVRLESARHRAIVLAEDLGTVPEGFSERLAEAGVLGMRVLWFELDGAAPRPPQRWSRRAVAMTSTHDLATVAGWWRGRDIDWRERIGLVPDPAQAHAARAAERAALWQAFRDSGAATGEPPAIDDPAAAADAACAHVARAASVLAVVQLEDVLAQDEQPNLPGTPAAMDNAHPNWRRRHAGPAAALLDAPDAAARLAAIAAGRTSTSEPR